MNIFDKFFQRYSYKFPKGYPDMNDPNDVLLLENLLEKLGISLNETKNKIIESELDVLVKDTLSKDNKITKFQSYTELAKLTYEQYDLGDIKKIFPNIVNTIQNWRQYVDKDLSNKGREVENALKNYSLSKNVESKEIGGKGEDITIGDKTIVEVKSSQGNKINTQLQTSFYANDPNKFYAFVTNTSSNDIQVRIVASVMLRKLSLGDEIVDEIESTGGSEILVKQIESGLETLDLKKFIISSILTGKTSEDSKSFFIGKDNKIRCRFVIYIEPK